MATVADVLTMLEKLLNDMEDMEDRREAQRCLHDICEEHGMDKLRKMISGHCYTVVWHDGDVGETNEYGMFTTWKAAGKAADLLTKEQDDFVDYEEDAKQEARDWREQNPGKRLPAGWWAEYYSDGNDWTSIYVANKTNFTLPILMPTPTLEETK